MRSNSDLTWPTSGWPWALSPCTGGFRANIGRDRATLSQSRLDFVDIGRNWAKSNQGLELGRCEHVLISCSGHRQYLVRDIVNLVPNSVGLERDDSRMNVGRVSTECRPNVERMLNMRRRNMR